MSNQQRDLAIKTIQAIADLRAWPIIRNPGNEAADRAYALYLSRLYRSPIAKPVAR